MFKNRYEFSEKARKYFSAKEGFVCDIDIHSQILRIRTKHNGLHSRLHIEEKIDENFGKFDKSTRASCLGRGRSNPEKENMAVVTFNRPEENIAYKAIFYNSWRHHLEKKPLKIFSSLPGEKWKTVESPSKDLILLCQAEQKRLYDNLYSKGNEGPSFR